MPLMIPRNLTGNCPIAEVLYKNLYTQLGSTDRVVQCLSQKDNLLGSLLWVQHQYQSLFIYLANSPEGNIGADTLNVNKGNTDTDNSAKDKNIDRLLQNNEISELLSLQQKLLPEALHPHCSKLAPFIIINPYVSNAKPTLALKSKGLYFFGKELIRSNTLGKVICKLLGIASSELTFQHIRRIFNPEIIIRSNNIDNSRSKMSLKVIKESLLDENQENVMKADIVLHSKHYRSNNFNLTGVSGCIASGKTETLIQRVKLIKQFQSNSKIVIITANCASLVGLRKRYDKLNTDKSVEIFSFNEWSKHRLKPSEHLVDETELTKIVDTLLKDQLEESHISPSIFLRELSFINGREIFYEKDYLATIENTRPYSLKPAQFSYLWRAVLTLKTELYQKKYLLVSRIPQLLLDKLQEEPVNSTYDHILVDDAHLLPPIAFELFKKVIKPESGQLFITQNQDQERPSQFWKDAELNLQDQNFRLSNTYKENLSIINGSRAFYANRLPHICNLEILANIKEFNESFIPRLLHFHSKNDEENRLLNEVKKLIHAGCDPQEILIISHEKITTYITKRIRQTLNIPIDLLNNFHFNCHNERNGIGVCNFQQAQGLDAPYVFIFGLQLLLVQENIHEEAFQYQAIRLENTHLITTAMTRASKELTLFITAKEIPQAFITPYISIPTDSIETKASVVSYLRKSG